MYSIARLTSLKYIHAMIIERLSTYGTPQDPSQWTKTTVAGAMFGRCLFSSGSLRGNVGMNGQEAALLLPFKALK